MVLVTLIFLLGANASWAADLEFSVLSNEITLQIGGTDVQSATLDAGEIVQGGTQFSPLSFNLTNNSVSGKAVIVSASVGDAVSDMGATLQPQSGTTGPSSGNFALLYGIGVSEPGFVAYKSLDGTSRQIIPSLVGEATETVWLKLILAEDAAAGNYTAPLTITGQYVE